MAGPQDLPIEIVDLIMSFLPPRHGELVESIRRTAEVARTVDRRRWYLRDRYCRGCNRITLEVWDGEMWWEQMRHTAALWREFESQGRYRMRMVWMPMGYWLHCPCGRLMGSIIDPGYEYWRMQIENMRMETWSEQILQEMEEMSL